MTVNLAIRINNLGKLYKIGGKREQYRTLRDTITETFSSPWRRFLSVIQNSRNKNKNEENTLWALKGITFEVNHGDVVGIIGRNGAGKSTLLKILSRITDPTEGSIDIFGRVGSLLEVGTGFHPELTGRENIYLNGAILGMHKAEIDKKFDEIVAFAEIERFLDTPVKHYSSGMYVRLAFAVAAHLETEILMVDEVLAVGDSMFQKKCLGKMEEVAQGGRTVLFVSHNMAVIQELCPRVILLDRGKIAIDGEAHNVINYYLSAHSTMTEGSRDISSPELRYNSLAHSRFYWTRITLLDKTGNPKTFFNFGEPFTIQLEANINADISYARIGFAINSAVGVPIFNAIQLDYGLPSKLEAGKVIYHISINPNILAPGLYEIGLGANGENVLDWLPAVIQFHIADVGEVGGSAWHNYSGGFIRYPCNWSFDHVGFS